MKIITVMPVIIALLSSLLIIMVAKTYHPGQVIVREYERVNNQLKEKKSSIFDYEKINAYLIANGAAFHYGAWINPIKYIVIKLITAAILFCVSIRIHWIIALLFSIIGYQLPGLLLSYFNKKDNVVMISQIQTVYNALIVMIKSGVFITDALAECYRRLPDGRLRTALEELSGELDIKNSFDSAIKKFNKKFNNEFINSLCIILLQAKETGQSVVLLKDISKQLNDMNAISLMDKKGKLDRTLTICLLGIVCAGIGIVIYAIVTELLLSVGSL